MLKTLKTFWLEIILALPPILFFIKIGLEYLLGVGNGADFFKIVVVTAMTFLSIFTFILMKQTTRSLGTTTACGWLLCYLAISPLTLLGYSGANEGWSLPEMLSRVIFVLIAVMVLGKYWQLPLQKKSELEIPTSTIEWIKLIVVILIVLFFALQIPIGPQIDYGDLCISSECTKTVFFYPWHVIVFCATLVMPPLYLCHRQIKTILSKTKRKKGDTFYALMFTFSILYWLIVSLLRPWLD